MIVSLSLAACADAPPPSGFEPVGGSPGDGGAGGEGAGSSMSNSMTTSTMTTSTMTTSTMTTSTMTTSTMTTSTMTTTSAGLMCDQEESESNDTESSAPDLGTADDCDAMATVAGVLEGVNDIDWYKYKGVDASGCSIDPLRTVMGSETVRFCKYFQCIDEEPDFDCPAGTQSATSPDGRDGCCSSQGFAIDGFICGSSKFNDDSAWVYMSIETVVNHCVDYSIRYDF